MDDVIIVENYVDSQCIRHLHLMSNFFINRPAVSLERGELRQETGVWHYRAMYPYRGVLGILKRVESKVQVDGSTIRYRTTLTCSE